ncbi:E3 ubiquitin-protein ligase ATL6-like [Silene latifolia]|uniref:E3 ubiquitin-protein ligase ATL6-like n=1 Tax=Silene latifolia TaxID=37657 RepID=UPI003D789D94
MTILHEKPTFLILISLLPILLLLCQPAYAQPTPPGQSGLGNQQGFSPSMGVIIIVLIAALFFMGFFSIYIRHCTEVNAAGTGVTTRRILAGSITRSRRAPRGLDPTVIEGFPTFDYAAVKTAKIGKGALECAVCLTEFEDDDTLRLIPHCDHVFHPDCIDQWLSGHTTCPVCRANLTEPVTILPDINLQNGHDTVLHVIESENSSSSGNNNIDENESMEQPLHGSMRRNHSMMRNISFGRPRWMGKFSRSFSTGHVAVKQWENMDRFTLRLPNEVRKQIMTGRLERSTSLVALPRESSTRRGYRTGFGEGTSRARSGSVRSDHVIGRSDRWIFSLAPPFISRVPSVKSPLDINRDGSVRGSIREGSLRGSVRSGSTRMPV